MADVFVRTESSLIRGVPRTQKEVGFTHKTSFNAGVAVPLLCARVYPGTTIQMNLHSITRMATPINPIMDDIYQDFHFFFVPMRVLFDKVNGEGSWDEFIAKYDWNSVNPTKLPTIEIPEGNLGVIRSATVGHYLGLPLGGYDDSHNARISLLPLYGYVDIWNTYFRDENYQKEVFVQEDVDDYYDGDKGPNSNPYTRTHITYFDTCMFVNEFHDPFTSVLPKPQKGPETFISLGDLAPVVTQANPSNFGDSGAVLQFRKTDGTLYKPVQYQTLGLAGSSGSLKAGLSETTPGGLLDLMPANLYADLSQSTAITINKLRDSIVLQHYLETLARSGSRYNEWLLGFFDVVSPDARLQRPEYIVGKRVPINISEVLQTSGEAVNDTVLGSTGGVSRTATSNNNMFTYSAVEHGFLFCITCVRHALTYSQGLSRIFTDIDSLDLYNPIFNGIGEQPIYTREVLLKTSSVGGAKRPEYSDAGIGVTNYGSDATILGYQEAWWDVFHMQNRASGLLDPVGSGSLASWTLTKAFDSATITGAQIRVADDVTLDRAIRVQNQDQFIGEYFFDMTVTAKKPLRSLPGLTRI